MLSSFASNAEDARRMLEMQSGWTSDVHSGLSLVSPEGKEWTGLSSSSVTFKDLSESEIEWWITGRYWEGRSGGFQIDGKGQLMISQIAGDWTSIVGLPVFLLGELMRKGNAPFVYSF
jgi:septum formation protein